MAVVCVAAIAGLLLAQPSFARHVRAEHRLCLVERPFEASGLLFCKGLPRGSTESASARGQFHPWTYDPICIEDPTAASSQYCVYTDSTFANGRGISLIGTPKSVRSVVRTTAFIEHTLQTQASTNKTHEDDQLFSVRALPGRGYGLIASRPLDTGTSLFAHTPVILMQASIERVLDEASIIFLLRNGIADLPPETRDTFMALHGHFGGDAVYDRFDTNAFNVFDFAGVFPETSRLNHACRANSHYYFDKSQFTHHVNTVRPIAAGEEITISYINPHLNSTARRARITQQWGFTCSCTLCTSPPPLLAASDQRLSVIANLESALSKLQDSTPHSAPTSPPGEEEDMPVKQRKPALTSVELLVKLYEKEELHAPVARAYALAAREYQLAGNVSMAEEYVNKAIRAGVLWRGPGSKEVAEMRALRQSLMEADSLDIDGWLGGII